MLSICLPVYNVYVSGLVNQLCQQRAQVNIPVEIVIIDDASNEAFKSENKKHVPDDGIYVELKQNRGRAAIRNLFLHYAQYPFLLFMDCDAELGTDDFLANYTEMLNDKHVVCGGRIYPKPPIASAYSLHWKYGITRETKTVPTRNNHPYASFMTNNFVIHREVLQRIPFDETLSFYGHEDTLFGLHLQQNNIVVKHIDNPVIHGQLEDNRSFVRKTRQAVRNLFYIYQQYAPNIKLLENNIRLLKYYKLARKTGLSFILSFIYKSSQSLLKKQLESAHPSLFILDLLKLSYFCYLSRSSR